MELELVEAPKASRPWVDSNFVSSDSGCEYSPSCFTCPRVVCKYDEEQPVDSDAKLVRNVEIQRAFKGGDRVKDLAARFGISERQVHRIIYDYPKAKLPKPDPKDQPDVPVSELPALRVRRFRPAYLSKPSLSR